MIRRDERGTILISAMWILAILSVLALGIGFRVSLELKSNRYSIDKLKARYIAMAGYVKASDELSRSKNAYDTLFACGVTFQDDAALASFFAGPLDDGQYSVGYGPADVRRPGLVDEERFININTAGAAQLARLPGLGPEIAACIIDWRDADDVELEGGAEKEHYSSLDRPYKCKNAPFTVPEELRLVKGVTGDVFEKMKGFVTVYGDGKVNVNTAPREVLVALGMTEDLADRIIAYRNGADAKPGTSDDGVFRDVNIEVALKDLSASEGAVVASLKNSFTTKSGYFRIESLGTVRSKVKRTFISVVKKGEGKCQSVSFREY